MQPLPPHIVVGVSDEPECLPAARWAVREATARGLTLVIAHASPLPFGDPPLTGRDVDAILAGAKAVVDRVMSHLNIPPRLEVRTVVDLLPPVALLRRLAEDAELVVLGRENLAPLRKVTGGAVTAPICAAAPCPVVVLPAYRSVTSRQPVVAAVDGTTAAASTLQVAFDEAALWSLPLTVLHAGPEDEPATETAERRVNIEEILAGWKGDYPDVLVHSEVVPGVPAELIAGFSEHAALMVVARPHRRRLGSWSRSVANAVLSHCECPLVVVPESHPSSPGAAADRRLTTALP